MSKLYFWCKKKMVNQLGRDTRDNDMTALMAAAGYEHVNIVHHLLCDCEADPTITNIQGQMALHIAAYNNKQNTIMNKNNKGTKPSHSRYC